MSPFRLHPDVVSDLEEIWDYIAEDNPDAADRAVADIFESLQTLVRFPHQGFQRPDLTPRPLRFKLVSDFLIAYAPDEAPLLVLAILHGSRKSPSLGRYPPGSPLNYLGTKGRARSGKSNKHAANSTFCKGDEVFGKGTQSLARLRGERLP
jgi:plasmid stabilization system protein ParE